MVTPRSTAVGGGGGGGKERRNHEHPSASTTPLSNTIVNVSTMMNSIYFKAGPTPAGSWRIQDRIKTVAAGLVLCLHIGVDPPDILKTVPCAVLECWIDPFAPVPQGSKDGKEEGSNVKALDVIGKSLVGQYEFWQPRARYKILGDPTVEEIKRLTQSLRKTAKDERVLIHWNGHGTPRPTKAGEVWVFNRQYTQYIPLAVVDIVGWLGFPCTFVVDCSGAGHVYDSLISCIPYPSNNNEGKLMIVLAACQSNEILPMAPELPADLFTACLTTPLEVALRWHILQQSTQQSARNFETLNIHGRLNDRRTPLGELHWIFTAITDTIAWLIFPRDLFKVLFRQDLLTASLMRNFILAIRVMKAYQCNPVSCPSYPQGSHNHKLWLVWDHVLDFFIKNSSKKTNQKATGQFFIEQMDAFEAWIDHAILLESECTTCEHLPIVLQVLLSQSQRGRALQLLCKFFDLGSWAARDALDVGVFPYILKLLQSPCVEIKPALLSIWSRVMLFDPSTSKDLIKDDAFMYFVRLVMSTDDNLALVCLTCFVNASNDHRTLALKTEGLVQRVFDLAVAGKNKLWAINCLSVLWDGLEQKHNLVQSVGYDIFKKLVEPFCSSLDWQIRASVCRALSTFISEDSIDLPSGLLNLEQDSILLISSVLLSDPSPLVRIELIICLSHFVAKHFNRFALAAYDIWNGDDGASGEDQIPRVSGDIVRHRSVYSVIWHALLALTLDPDEEIVSLASALVDEIHLSFLFVPSTVRSGNVSPLIDSKELLFVQDESIIHQPSPVSSPTRLVLTSALPLPSQFISASLKRFISNEIVPNIHTNDHIKVNVERKRHLWECQQLGGTVKFDKQLALLANGSLPVRVTFHPYQDRLIVADSRNRVSVWDWAGNIKNGLWVNGNPDKNSQICGLIPIQNDRLIVASTNGVARCWKPDYSAEGQSASLEGVHQLSFNGSKDGKDIFEVDWDAQNNLLWAVASDDPWLASWDMNMQRSTRNCSLGVNSTPTSLRTSVDQVFVGYSNGLLVGYDPRSSVKQTGSFQAHDHWLVDIVQVADNPHQLVTASVIGDIAIIDRRRPDRILRYDVLTGQAGLLTLCGHSVLPVIAMGSSDQTLRFLGLSDAFLSPAGNSSSSTLSSSFALHTVKYHEGLFGQRIGVPASAAFHPTRPIYAAASTDQVVAIYGA